MKYDQNPHPSNSIPDRGEVSCKEVNFWLQFANLMMMVMMQMVVTINMLMTVMVILKLIINAHRSGQACHIPCQLVHLVTITITINDSWLT